MHNVRVSICKAAIQLNLANECSIPRNERILFSTMFTIFFSNFNFVSAINDFSEWYYKGLGKADARCSVPLWGVCYMWFCLIMTAVLALAVGVACVCAKRDGRDRFMSDLYFMEPEARELAIIEVYEHFFYRDEDQEAGMTEKESLPYLG